MTTTDLPPTDPFRTVPPPPPPSGGRVLRRSRTGRVASGVSAGLGEYFAVDPVLFRVLFATSAFFGGAGILAYLCAWAAIPDEGTTHAPIDGWISTLRRRHVPLWAVALVGALVLWAVAFSWWLPGPAFFAIVVGVLLVVFFGRRELQAGRPGVVLAKSSPAAAKAESGTGTWVTEVRAWVEENREASRRRRRRARPVLLTTVLSLAAALAVLGITDSVTGIDLQWYFWSTLVIVGLGLVVGAVARRFPAGITWLLVPAVLGVLAFSGSHASLHDGSGKRVWKPTAAPQSQYRLTFGQGILDLRSLAPQATPRTIRVTMAAGQVTVLAAPSANVAVVANVHIGSIRVDGERLGDDNGIGLRRDVDPPAGATGGRITVVIHLADGDARVDRR